MEFGILLNDLNGKTQFVASNNNYICSPIVGACSGVGFDISTHRIVSIPVNSMGPTTTTTTAAVIPTNGNPLTNNNFKFQIEPILSKPEDSIYLDLDPQQTDNNVYINSDISGLSKVRLVDPHNVCSWSFKPAKIPRLKQTRNSPPSLFQPLSNLFNYSSSEDESPPRKHKKRRSRRHRASSSGEDHIESPARPISIHEKDLFPSFDESTNYIELSKSIPTINIEPPPISIHSSGFDKSSKEDDNLEAQPPPTLIEHIEPQFVPLSQNKPGLPPTITIPSTQSETLFKDAPAPPSLPLLNSKDDILTRPSLPKDRVVDEQSGSSRLKKSPVDLMSELKNRQRALANKSLEDYEAMIPERQKPKRNTLAEALFNRVSARRKDIHPEEEETPPESNSSNEWED